MTLATPAQHGAAAQGDGGWDGADRRAPVSSRALRFASVDRDAFPVVQGYESEWKLTPVDAIRDLIEGELDGAAYPIHHPEVEGTTVEWIDRSDSRIGSAGIPEDRAAANAWGSFRTALRVGVSGDAAPLTITRTGFGAEPRAAHVLIDAESGSSGLVILDSSGPASLSENVEVVVGADAHLTVVSLQEWDDDARHLSSQLARIARGGHLTHIVVSVGGSVVRVTPSVHLAEEGAEAELLGLYVANAGQHREQRVFVHHDAPHTRSRVNYKGTLNGSGARTVWVGDVLIARSAPGTDTYEENRNLVLSEGTRADSIPNLEIETGDIVGAGHASATGRFDDTQLFYLQSRGIAEPEARRLIVLGFLAEIVHRIQEPALEARLLTTLEDEVGNPS